MKNYKNRASPIRRPAAVVRSRETRHATRFCTALILLCLVSAGIIGCLDYAIPSNVSLNAEQTAEELALPIGKLTIEDRQIANEDSPLQTVTGYASVLGGIPVKSVTVSLCSDTTVYPGGMTFGIQMNTQGVMVVGLTTVNTKDSTVSPAYDSGIRTKDIILKIDGKEVNTADEVTALVEESQGKAMTFTVLRSGKEMTFSVTAVPGQSDGAYRIGIWIRHSTAGIGTVTCILPQSGAFVGLGHGICDSDTGVLLPLRDGVVTGVTVSHVAKGKVGAPGELQGYLCGPVCGTLTKNAETGLYGCYDTVPEIGTEAVKIATRDEVKNGEAVIRSCVGGELRSYTVTLSDVGRSSGSVKNFIVTVTDPDLLNLTGGIVQGMSGSPILQNGKLVGAVTHVLINDPTKGYGIYIDNMLSNMP